MNVMGDLPPNGGAASVDARLEAALCDALGRADEGEAFTPERLRSASARLPRR